MTDIEDGGEPGTARRPSLGDSCQAGYRWALTALLKGLRTASRIALLVCLGFAAPVLAAESNRAAIDDCDRLAASADDPDRPSAVAGVKLQAIDARAVQVCRVAIVTFNPSSEPGAAIERRRLHFELGRALHAAKNYGRAWAAYGTAAAAGSPEAMNNLGALYEDGLGVASDFSAARIWYEKAAAAGNSDAMISLGVHFMAAENYAAAKPLYEKAAAAGNPSAMFNLGIMFAEGQGIAQDYGAAKRWWEKAAAAGDVDSMFNLGVVHDEGMGAPRDYRAAKDWYEKAAAAGHAAAMNNLGVLYENGHGLPADPAAAHAWYEKSAANGYRVAQTSVERLKGAGR